MTKGLLIDGYSISVEDRKLLIDGPELVEPINLVFTPLQASQLSVALNKLVPDDYGVRSDFRIPVTQDMGLKTLMLLDDREHTLETTSLSLSGMYAEIDVQQTIASPGDVCQLVFEFEDISVALNAMVTRSQISGIGAAFIDPEPSEDHSKLVMAVQRKWIAVKSG